MGKSLKNDVNIMYSNIQGFSGKKDSLCEIIETSDCNIILLTETMTTNIKMQGMKCITSQKSIGQNVAIIIRGRLLGAPLMKLYEPNVIVNMLGIRIECAKNNHKRIYTAHLKQSSTNSREVIREQFSEIISQFHQAKSCNEGMVLIFDANVHMGKNIPGCQDVQDWCGKELLQIINDEGLYLINSTSKCKGIVTRVDPRNGAKSTIDLVICNEYMDEDIIEMEIDEEERFKPTKYAKNSITKTDHNTMFVKIKAVKLCKKAEKTPFINTKCNNGKVIFAEKIKEADTNLFNMKCNLDEEYGKLMKMWNGVMSQSFKKITPSDKYISGMDKEIKELIKEERVVKGNVNMVGRMERLRCVRKEISVKINDNRSREMGEKIAKIYEAKCPQAEVFKIRKECKRGINIDFPLRNKDGVICVTKKGIDEVITDHFIKVFNQNPVPPKWENYWQMVNNVYDIISKKEIDMEKDLPTIEEVTDIIKDLKKEKAVYGDMTIELLKLAGENMIKIVHKCICECFEQSVIPDKMRYEKMVLLYKHKGKLDVIDNYRGIFLRAIILTIYQKWLYEKCAPIVNKNGSEVAFGGRKGKSPIEALLLIKLIQDYAVWTGCQIILKFLDVEKIFDSMNFMKSMIDVYQSGVNGKYWKAYENINKKKDCVPYIPSGECTPIKVNNVFVQGSTDAVLLAWNHMDSLNKKETNIWDKTCVIEGIKFDAITFVDDIVEICKSQEDLIISSARLETFQNETRLKFKTTKCKLVVTNKKETLYDVLGTEELEIKEMHTYLGTIVSSNGKRNEEVSHKINETKGVCNEIVVLLKSTELAPIRLKQLMVLSNACVDGKFKYGSGIWNKQSIKTNKELNNLKINMVKRVMELPFSTPSTAVQCEFGMTDLSLDIRLEKIMVYVKMLKKENSVGNKLLEKMMQKNVPGFCTELSEDLEVFGLECMDIKGIERKSIRHKLKEKITKLQGEILWKKMAEESKSNWLLINFNFNSCMKKYLTELEFVEARVIFMIRSRMFPTKENFKGRWGNQQCSFCDKVESDIHLFSCPGYFDLLKDVNFWDFIKLDVNMEVLSAGAKRMLEVKSRLELFNKSEKDK